MPIWFDASLASLSHGTTSSGLINQSVVAGGIFLVTITAHECMRRRRRGKGPHGPGLGSVESWEFG